MLKLFVSILILQEAILLCKTLTLLIILSSENQVLNNSLVRLKRSVNGLTFKSEKHYKEKNYLVVS